MDIMEKILKIPWITSHVNYLSGESRETKITSVATKKGQRD